MSQGQGSKPCLTRIIEQLALVNAMWTKLKYWALLKATKMVRIGLQIDRATISFFFRCIQRRTLINSWQVVGFCSHGSTFFMWISYIKSMFTRTSCCSKFKSSNTLVVCGLYFSHALYLNFLAQTHKTMGRLYFKAKIAIVYDFNTTIYQYWIVLSWKYLVVS